MTRTKNFNEFLNEKFDVINNDLKSEIKEYLLTNYPSDWWETQLQDRVMDYIDSDDLVGDGDPDDEETWDYIEPTNAYKNLSTGGAIEYDLLGEIRNDIRDKFHLTDQEYDRNEIGEIAEEHMCNMIDWYDKGIFGENAGDPLGMRKGYQNLMSNLDDKWNESIEIKTPGGKIIKL